jgi:DNA-binding HxlR family transcriptional regulator
MITPSRAEREGSARRRRPKLREGDTPLGTKIGVLGKKWTLLIIRQVAAERRPSFSQLLRAHHKLSRRILSIRLKELQQEGYLEKIISIAHPRRTAYVLTDKGRDALPLLHAFSDLVKVYGEGVPVARGRVVRVEDVCFTHPEIREPAAPRPAPLWNFEGVPGDAPPKVMAYKDQCCRCKAPLRTDSEAYVCSFECTWCRRCVEDLGWHCPNCNQELRARPRLPAPELLPPGLRVLDSG